MIICELKEDEYVKLYSTNNFLNEKNENTNKYYIKLSDELIRFPIIRDYLLFINIYF